MNSSSATPSCDFDFDKASFLPPPTNLRDMVQTLVHEECVGLQKRAAARFRMATEIRAVPLDDQLRPAGDPFVALSRNISTGGICLVHTRPLEAPFLLIRLDKGQGASMQLVLRIRHCRRLKRFYEIGCEFLTRREQQQTEPQ